VADFAAGLGSVEINTTMKFKTHTDELYEIDKDNKQIRRLDDGPQTTKRITKEWRAFEDVFPVGGGLLVVWGTGADEVSATCGQIGDCNAPGMTRTRTTLIAAGKFADDFI